jgi:two-component system NtrC family response regulator
VALPRLLIVEDDEAIRTQLKYALQPAFALTFAEDRVQAIAAVSGKPPEVVVLDLGLPPSPNDATEGLRTLDELLQVAPRTKVIILTGNAERQHALSAVQLGAFDYQVKPVDIDTLLVMLGRALFHRSLEHDNDARFQEEERSAEFEAILGTTASMREIFKVIDRVSRTDATVLIEGESGTGKELIAAAIHRRSRRRTGAFVAINCGAIPETLMEAELFGHEKGAFTGAHIQRRGKLELADRGTLFLDEIGELSLMLQVKLLRFLQEHTIERVGGRESIKLDLRVIAATNRDLKAQLQRGLLRQDLYYRLSVVSIQLPPLRERGNDILLLANAFLRRAAAEHRRKVRFSPDALQALMAHPWPGNIRELENKVSRAVIMAPGPLIQPVDLDIRAVTEQAPVSLVEARGRAEREVLVAVLSRHRGNISQAARELRVSRPTLHSLLERYRVDAKAFK